MAGRPWSQATTTRVEEPSGGAQLDARVLGWTVLYHPELARVGERALLTGLQEGRAFELSRAQPLFGAPGQAAGRPLDDARISRAPIYLRGLEGGGVELDGRGSRTSLVVERAGGGAAPLVVEGVARFGADEVARGLLVMLGREVVLLLDWMDPVSDAGQERYGLMGESAGIVRVRRDIRKVAGIDVPVLVRGESGSGKELVARALHEASARRGGPYVAVNLGAVPQALAAAELFGAVRGAFTGAVADRQGTFQRAHGGTLFLDEVGEAAAELQVLLLRALETREVQAVGADKTKAVDVRVVSATDADLEEAIAAARFRAPLLYRLGGYVIRVPPLRERRDDVGRLLVAFLRRELEALGEVAALDGERGAAPWLPASEALRLLRYDWPGNVRQLSNTVRQLVIANRGLSRAQHFEALDELTGSSARAAGRAAPSLSPAAIPPLISAAPSAAAPPAAATAPPAAPRPGEITEEELMAALRDHGYSPERAAAALGIPRPSIYRLIDRSPRVRKASELSAEEILAAKAEADGDEEAMAQRLFVSTRALRRRMGELGLRP